MLKTGIYVDAENIRLSGGYGMRYDVLAELANAGPYLLLCANSYVVEDQARTREDPEYRQKLYNYFEVLRRCGFRIIKKYVKFFVDEEGEVTTKANADMDLAIDALLQSCNLDRVILVSGDGDFRRVVTALQNKGCRVEVIGFDNVSTELREAADLYLSGYLVPRLLPIARSGQAEEWYRGTVINYNTARGFGFMRYYKLTNQGLSGESVFFHYSQSGSEFEPQAFLNPNNIFEFRIAPNSANLNRLEAQEIKLFGQDDEPG